jgi:hypothetical protein
MINDGGVHKLAIHPAGRGQAVFEGKGLSQTYVNYTTHIILYYKIPCYIILYFGILYHTII